MTFKEWTKSLGYALTANELYRMRQSWEIAWKYGNKTGYEDGLADGFINGQAEAHWNKDD